MKLEKSKKLFEEAKKYIPGGVNSPVRAFKSVGGTPPFIVKGKGAYIYDEDGNRYIDFVSSWGPLILGHANDEVVKSIEETAKRGTSFGAPTQLEIKLAEKIVKHVPSVEKVRLVNSGTEATMSAIRLARGYTKRNKVLKFEGCYHGHFDSFLIKAGSGVMTFSIPGTPGVPEDFAKLTLLAPYNDIKTTKKIIEENEKDLAAVIVEPVAGNMGVIPPKIEFLKMLREETQKRGIILIFDEVITGFRIGLGGAQKHFGIIPDLTTLGKIIGGGLPLAAYGGKGEIMDHISPVGDVYQAGTLSGNPLAVSAGLKTIEILEKLEKEEKIYEKLSKNMEKVAMGIEENLKKLGLKYKFNHIGSMGTLFFSKEDVVDFKSASKSDTKLFSKYFHNMLEEGIYLPPSQFEAMFLSMEHGEWEIEKFLEKNFLSLKKIKGA